MSGPARTLRSSVRICPGRQHRVGSLPRSISVLHVSGCNRADVLGRLSQPAQLSMILPIIKYGDALLQKVCEPVTVFDKALETLAKNMVETMYAAPGVGLAAPQVGVLKRLIVVDVTAGEKQGQLI